MTASASFCIKRLVPEEAVPLQASWLRAKRKPSQRSYSIITDAQRYMVLSKVLAKELTVSEAAIQYGLKYTTAKNILDLFVREGRVEKKKNRVKPHSTNKSDGSQEKRSGADSPIETGSSSLHNLVPAGVNVLPAEPRALF